MNENTLDFYKSLNYKIQVEFSTEDNCWYASIPDLWDTSADAETPEKAFQKAFRLKDEILELAYKDGRDIPLPRPDIEYSGRFLLRVPKTLHAKLAAEAEREGTSINRLAIQFLSAELERRQTLRTVTDEIRWSTFASVGSVLTGASSRITHRILPSQRQERGVWISGSARSSTFSKL